MPRKTRFEVTKDHRKLAKHMYVDWNDMETGAPTVDPKRPYGNSDVEGDIAEILGWTIEHPDEGLCDQQYNEATRLHKEMETVLQILLSTLSLSAGTYELVDEYGNTWKKVS